MYMVDLIQLNKLSINRDGLYNKYYKWDMVTFKGNVFFRAVVNILKVAYK